MAHPRSTDPQPTATALLSVLAELAGDGHSALSPLEAGARLLRQGMDALGAAGGIARVVGSRSPSVDIVEVGSTGGVPAAAAEMVAGGEEAWLSTSREIRARFSGSTPPELGALVSVRIASRRASRRAASRCGSTRSERSATSNAHFLRALGQTARPGGRPGQPARTGAGRRARPGEDDPLGRRAQRLLSADLLPGLLAAHPRRARARLLRDAGRLQRDPGAQRRSSVARVPRASSSRSGSG